MNYQRFIGKRKLLVERSLELLAILITIIIGFISHKENLISIKFLINFVSFSISWLILSFLINPNFKNVFILSLYSSTLGALIRAIILKEFQIPVSFILVFYTFQTIMLYIFRAFLIFIK